MHRERERLRKRLVNMEEEKERVWDGWRGR